MFKCSLIKGITPKIRMLCFVLINSVLLDLFGVLGSSIFYVEGLACESDLCPDVLELEG